MSDTKNYGIVYLLTNPCMPGIVKIGKTSRTDLQNRMKELYTTGVPVPFECVYACRIKLSHMDKLETTLHSAFEPYRVNKNREFFSIKPEQAIAFMKFVDNIQDVTSEVSAEIANDLTTDDTLAIAKVRKKRPSINFYEMGMHDGDVLVWCADAHTGHGPVYGGRRHVDDADGRRYRRGDQQVEAASAAADHLLHAGRADHDRRTRSSAAGAAGAVHSQSGSDSFRCRRRGSVSGHRAGAHDFLDPPFPYAGHRLCGDLPAGSTGAEGLHSGLL